MEKQKTKSGTLEDYLYKDERNNISKVVSKEKKNSKFAKLDYEVLKYNEIKDLSLVKVNLHTGRHHQIRVLLGIKNMELEEKENRQHYGHMNLQ